MMKIKTQIIPEFVNPGFGHIMNSENHREILKNNICYPSGLAVYLGERNLTQPAAGRRYFPAAI